MAQDPATVRAVAALTRSRAQAQALGGKTGGKKPSMLSRIFDVISRPLYGVSEGLARASEHVGPANPRKGKNAGLDILAGIAGGLAGKNKTDIGNTLQRAAEADPNSLLSKPIRQNRYNIKTLGGLVGDIVFDPITYSGVGVLKGLGKGAAEVAGLRAAQEAIETGSNVERVLKAGSAARESAMEKKILKAATKSKSRIAKIDEVLQSSPDEHLRRKLAAERNKLVDKGGEVSKTTKKANSAAQRAMKAETEIIRDEARSTIGRNVTERLLAENPGSVQLKFMGKKIAESEKLYKGTAKLGKVVGATEVGKSLNEAFRTAAKFPELTNRLKRQTELHGIEKGTQSLREMRDFFKPLTRDEKTMIPHLIEGRVNTAGLKTAAGDDLAKYVDKARDMFRTMGEDEIGAKIFRKKGGVAPENFLHDNYVYHWYEGGAKALQKEYKNSRRLAVGPETPGFTMQRKLKTLKDAKAAGLKPLESIDDILAKRMGKHYQSMARGHFVDAVGKEYGTQVGKLSRAERAKLESEGYRASKSAIQEKGVVFPEHIAKSLDVLEDMHNSDELYNKFIRVFDKVQNQWKFGATQLNPGHHIRNMIGDAWNGFVDGIDNPKYYEQAMRMGSGDRELSIRVGNRVVKKPELLELEARYGAKSGFTPMELTSANKTNPLSKAKRAANIVGDKRETFMRRAHFLGALQQEAKSAKTLEEAAEKAAARVRKWKVDYGDFTDLERNVMKRAIPFYSWMRKNIPLQIEAMAMRPGRVSAIPKGQAAIQRILGTDEGGYANFGDLDTMSKWLQEMAPIRLRGEGEGKNALYWNAPLPFGDIGKYTEGGQQGILRELVSGITPIAKAPIELATGRNLYTDIPYKGNLDFLANLLPTTRLGRQAQTGNLKGTKLLNYLTGLGIQEVTPGQVQGELRSKQQSLSKQVKALRAKAAKR